MLRILCIGLTFALFLACALPQKPNTLTVTDQVLRLEITRAMLVAGGRLIEVRYRILGDLKAGSLNPKESYIVDESGGEIIFVEGVPRLFGGLRQMPPSYMVFRNNGLIKKDSIITVVIGGLRVEHVRVEGINSGY